MIPLSLLLVGAAAAAGALAWLVREITRADRQRIAEAWERLADVQRHVDDAWQVIAEQSVPQQLYDQVEVEDMYEWFALPSPLDVWEDGSCPRRRQDGER